MLSSSSSFLLEFEEVEEGQEDVDPGSHVILCLIAVRVVRGGAGRAARGGGGGGTGGRGPHRRTRTESHRRRPAARHVLCRARRPHVGRVERTQRAHVRIPGKVRSHHCTVAVPGFPRGRQRPLIFWPIFPTNCMKMKKIRPRRVSLPSTPWIHQ